MTTESKWRVRSRRRIQDVLEALPAGHTLKDAVRALRDGYPFSDRSGFAYQVWLDERKKALLPYRAKEEAKKPPPSRTGVFLTKRHGVGLPWLTVQCAWCRGEVKDGCMVCNKYHEALKAILVHPLRLKLWQACVAKEEGAIEALRDFYLDNNVQESEATS